MFKRHLLKQLQQWKSSKNRKPLLLRGARQVGKSTLVNQFAKQYTHYIPLNLERMKDLEYFEKFEEPSTLVNALLTTYDIPSKQISETLLFIDEIQASPKAIAKLRYFYEDVPELQVIAAGSLLEHVMGRVPSFPVGRIQYLYLQPFNFLEYLQAIEHKSALQAISTVPVPRYAHKTLIELFNEYTIIGGMPEVLQTYIESKSLSDLSMVYENIWETYKNDVEKYAKNTTEERVINHIVNTAHTYLDQRIKFQNFGSSNYKSREVGEAFRKLNDAKVIQLIYPTTNMAPPVQPDFKKSPRLQFLDTGIVNYELNIQPELLAMSDLSSAYKGSIIPHIITQEFISLNTYKYQKPNFWVREKTQSSAEVDLIYPYNGMLIPIEIKSGKVGKLRSLHQFVEQSNHPYAIRMYAGEFKIETHKTASGKLFFLMNLPYYLTAFIEDYMDYFMSNKTR